VKGSSPTEYGGSASFRKMSPIQKQKEGERTNAKRRSSSSENIPKTPKKERLTIRKKTEGNQGKKKRRNLS